MVVHNEVGFGWNESGEVELGGASGRGVRIVMPSRIYGERGRDEASEPSESSESEEGWTGGWTAERDKDQANRRSIERKRAVAGVGRGEGRAREHETSESAHLLPPPSLPSPLRRSSARQTPSLTFAGVFGIALTTIVLSGTIFLIWSILSPAQIEMTSLPSRWAGGISASRDATMWGLQLRACRGGR